MKNGILLAAFGQTAYLAQAVLALESVRLHSELPITLVTDQPQLPVIAEAGFDSIIHLKLESLQGVPHNFALPLLARVRALLLSPYDCTLSLDVDARIRQPRLHELFKVCTNADIALAPCLVDTSHERVMYDRPLWNNGIILYKRTDTVVRLLKRFDALFSEHINAALTPDAHIKCVSHVDDGVLRKRLLCSDQIALAQLFSPVVNIFNLKYAHLPEHWNWRGGNSYRVCAEEIIIDHHPALRKNSFHQLAECAFGLLNSGNVAKSALYYTLAINTLDPELIHLSPTQHIELLSTFTSLKTASAQLNDIALDPQSASLLAVALFHQRTLQQTEKALSILNGLLARHRRL